MPEVGALRLSPEVEAIVIRRRAGDRRAFSKQYRTRWRQLAQWRWFRDEELAMLSMLSPWLNPNTNVVTDEGGRQVAPGEIGSLIGWSKRKAYRTLAALDQKNAVYVSATTRIRNGGVYVNPELYFAGRQPDATLLSLFLEKKNNALENEPGLALKQPKLRPPTTLLFRARSGTRTPASVPDLAQQERSRPKAWPGSRQRAHLRHPGGASAPT